MMRAYVQLRHGSKEGARAWEIFATAEESFDSRKDGMSACEKAARQFLRETLKARGDKHWTADMDFIGLFYEDGREHSFESPRFTAWGCQ